MAPPKRAQIPEFESFLRGGAQGATFGLADEIAGGVEGAGDVLVGGYNLSDLMDRYRARRDESRINFGAAEQDNPLAYGGGQFAGGLATTAIPGVNFIKGADWLSKAKTASKLGAAAGLGASEADLTRGDLGGAAGDVALGGTVGAGLQLGMTGLGSAARSLTPRNLAKKSANVFLNTPEQITEKYIADPGIISRAEPVYKVGTEFVEEGLPGLKRLATEGSAASRKLLREEGGSIPRSRVAEIYNKAAEDIADKAEGVISDPQKAAAYKAFKTAARKYSADIDPTTGRRLPDNLSTNRLKDELQSLDRMTEYKIGPGSFGKVDNTLKKQVRKQLNEELGAISPAYKELIPQVAEDARLLGEAKDLSKSKSSFTNLFKKLSRDEYGAGQIPRETLEKVDARLGTNYVKRAEDAMIKQAFDSSITNGSMNVNKFAAMGRDIPVVKYIAPLVGAAVDKYGRKMTVAAVDKANTLHKIAETQTAQEILRTLQPLFNTAQAGNKAAALTLMMFQRANPNLDYGKLKAQQEGLN